MDKPMPFAMFPMAEPPFSSQKQSKSGLFATRVALHQLVGQGCADGDFFVQSVRRSAV